LRGHARETKAPDRHNGGYVMLKKLGVFVLFLAWLGGIIYGLVTAQYVIIPFTLLGGMICLGVYGALIYVRPTLEENIELDKPSGDLSKPDEPKQDKPSNPLSASTMKFDLDSKRPAAVYFGERVQRDKNGKDIFTGEAVNFTGDEHVLLIGPTRSGKGRAILAPNLILDTSRSALVVDPKGELAGWTAKHRKAAGHEIIYLDPFRELAKDDRLNTEAGRVISHGFNPLRFLDPKSDYFLDDVMGTTEAIVQVGETKEPHWAESAQDFVAGLIMQEVAAKGKKASYRHIRELIGKTDAHIGIYCDEFCKTPLHSMIPNKLNRFVPLSDSNSEGNRELSSIISNARTQTRFLDSVLISEDLSKGDDEKGTLFDFGDMKRKLMTVYLVIPPAYLITHAKWLRLIIDAAIRSLQRVPKKESPHDVLFMLDEFAQYGRLNSIETSIALNAGYGIKIFAVIQSLAQLQHLYRDNWETIVSGGVIASFAPRDVVTSEYLSKMSGQEYVKIKGESLSRDGFSESVSKQLQPVLMPHEIRRMARGRMILFVPANEGQRMWRCRAPDFSKLPEIDAKISRT